MFERSVHIAKAIFTKLGDHFLSGLDFIQSIIGETNRPINDFNSFCLKKNLIVYFVTALIFYFLIKIIRTLKFHLIYH